LVFDNKKVAYALKEIKKDRFQEREWEVSKKLKGYVVFIIVLFVFRKSPNVVQLLQRVNVGCYVYILMEYCNHGCLTNIMKSKFPEEVANNIIFQIRFVLIVIFF
jgi:serine/threonine protein kinase